MGNQLRSPIKRICSTTIPGGGVGFSRAETESTQIGCRYSLNASPRTKCATMFDGDVCSWTPIFSEEANKECAEYLRTPGNLILPSGDALADICDDLVKMSMFAMTRDLPDLKK